MDEKRQPGLQFHQIFLSRATFGHRADALERPPDADFPDLGFQVNVQLRGNAAQKVAAVTLVVSSLPSDEAQYTVEVEITALVGVVPGEENLDPVEYAKTIAPAALYPYAREAISNLTMRGRFGPVFLKPLNFTALSPSVSQGSTRPEAPSAPPSPARVAGG